MLPGQSFVKIYGKYLRWEMEFVFSNVSGSQVATTLKHEIFQKYFLTRPIKNMNKRLKSKLAKSSLFLFQCKKNEVLL